MLLTASRGSVDAVESQDATQWRVSEDADQHIDLLVGAVNTHLLDDVKMECSYIVKEAARHVAGKLECIKKVTPANKCCIPAVVLKVEASSDNTGIEVKNADDVTVCDIAQLFLTRKFIDWLIEHMHSQTDSAIEYNTLQNWLKV